MDDEDHMIKEYNDDKNGSNNKDNNKSNNGNFLKNLKK